LFHVANNRSCPVIRKNNESDQLRRLHACSISTLCIFAAVVENRSFSGAARRMQLTPSTISKHINILESTLETPLVHRTTRQVSVTESGLLLYERIKAVLGNLEEAVNAVTCETSSIAGHLSLTAPPSFASTVLRPHLADFLSQYPNLSVEIQATSRTVDVVREGVDVAILFESQLSSKVATIKIAPDRRVFCASPAYIERHGAPSVPQDLSRHRCLINIYSSREGSWPFDSERYVPTSNFMGTVAANDGDMLRTVCLAGQGIGFFHHFHVHEYLESGQLCEVLKDHRPPPSAIFAIVPHHHFIPPKTEALLKHIRGCIRSP
jgi:DNA-binding transcriptional LysR family regulator